MINVPINISGYYKVRILNKDGTERFSSDWIKNLITNYGALGVKYGFLFDEIEVGAGTTAPTVTDTSLETQLAVNWSVLSDNVDTSDDYAYREVVYSGTDLQFYSINEMGIFQAGNLVSRVVLPDTIAVTPYDTLEITYQIRLRAPATQVVAITMDSTPYNVTISTSPYQLIDIILNGYYYRYNRFSTTANGTILADFDADYDQDAFSPYAMYDEYHHAQSVNFGINSSGSFSTVEISPHTLTFDPAVNKSPSQNFTLYIEYSWTQL